MKRLILLLLILLQCTSPSKKTVVTETPNDDLTKFFRQCESDIQRAKKVIIDNNIVMKLSHFQKMDSGGKKFYLLERESITKMINSVTEGIYSDIILINKPGKIIYTMENDNLFGKNVNGSLRETSLNRCYTNKNEDVHLEDVSFLPDNPGKYLIFVSGKVKGGMTFPGILILQINIKKIKSLLKHKSEVIGYDGNYRISSNNGIKTRYKHFNKIDLKEKKLNRFQVDNNTLVLYNSFKFKNISWIILSKRNL
ncbi:hypothetical protein ACFL20_12575 [Spirochaetota bacterium]